MNCDMANVNKTVDARPGADRPGSGRLESSGRLAQMPEKLRQAARLRLENPEMSLQQLAERSDPAGEQILHESSYAQTDGGSEGIP